MNVEQAYEGLKRLANAVVPEGTRRLRLLAEIERQRQVNPEVVHVKGLLAMLDEAAEAALFTTETTKLQKDLYFHFC